MSAVQLNLADVPNVEPYYFKDRSSPLFLCLKEIAAVIKASATLSEIWDGWKVTEPDSGLPYTRLQMRNTLGYHSPDINQEVRILVAVHLFEKVERAKKVKVQHNHRFPFLVAPFTLGTESSSEDELLYSMPWTFSKARKAKKSGTLKVQEGEFYSVYDALNFTHVVDTKCSHGSIVIADTTKEPLRADRLETYQLAREDIVRYLNRARPGIERVAVVVADPERADKERLHRKVMASVTARRRNQPTFHRGCTGID